MKDFDKEGRKLKREIVSDLNFRKTCLVNPIGKTFLGKFKVAKNKVTPGSRTSLINTDIKSILGTRTRNSQWSELKEPQFGSSSALSKVSKLDGVSVPQSQLLPQLQTTALTNARRIHTIKKLKLSGNYQPRRIIGSVSVLSPTNQMAATNTIVSIDLRAD